MESNKKLITTPIRFLSIYIIFTFIPVLYTYFPLFGTIKIVLIAGIGMLISYLVHPEEYTNVHAWRSPVILAWKVFIIIMILGLMVSFDRGLTFAEIQVVAKYLIVLAVMVKVIDSGPRLDFVLKLYSFCGVAMAVSTIFNYFISGTTFNNSIRGTAIESGIFADPNDLALFLNTTLPFLFYFLFTSKNKKVSLLAIIIVELAVMLTYSRGGFLGSCAVLLGVTFFRKAERNKILTLILVGVILFVGFAPDQYKERLSTITEEAQVDSQTGKYLGRMQAWVDLLPVGMHRPVLGAGAGCSVYLAGSNINDWHLIHNTFLQVFLEMGLLGFCCYLFFYIIPYRHYRRVKAHAREEEANRVIVRYQLILVSLFGFGIAAFFVPQAYSPIIFLLSGITVVQYELAEKAIAESRP